MKSINTESYENLAKNILEQDLKVFLANIDHRYLIEELERRLNCSVARDKALDDLVTKYEK